MPNQQKYRPISFRPPEADRLWLAGYAEQTGRPVNAILAEALREYRDARTLPARNGHDPAGTGHDGT
jgi:hypothetical protein